MPFRAPVGTATISGRIVSDEATPKPLRRATVTLRSDGYRTGWSYVTDDTGAFRFKNLPAGRFTLSATKPAYVTMPYGALKPGRPGQSIALLDGGSIGDLAVKLPKGAVITGTIRDETGAPVPNANVEVFRYVMKGGERTMIRSNFGGQNCDDRGVYRVFGLQAGEYAVSVGNSGILFLGGQSVRRIASSEFEAALRGANMQSATQRSAPPDDEQTVVNAPVYYPGTVISAQAGSIVVAAGEERAGVDITTMYVPAVNVEGHLIGPDGKLPQAVTLNMIEVGATGQNSRPRFGRPAADGKFTFNGISPGQYVITARATTATSTEIGTTNAPLFARADITVTGQKLSSLELTLDNGAVVSGQLQADPGASGPADFRSTRIGLEPILGKNDVALGVVSVTPDESGAFSIVGVTPGRYRVTVSAGAGRGWVAKSATIGGRDALDDGFDVASADISGVSVVMTNQTSEVSGVLQDASGRPAPDYYIILFPTDQKYWIQNSRRIKTARPGIDGKYILRDLPPGEYRIAAVTDVENGEWFEPAFLQQLVSASATVTLADGEKKSFPLKLGGG
jgi:protocatechuate 3,4-dioxygenase beta subunit